MVEKLKPCPFCGSTSLYVPENPEFDCYIRCENCECRTDRFMNIDSAIKAWNRRANDD